MNKLKDAKHDCRLSWGGYKTSASHENKALWNQWLWRNCARKKTSKLLGSNFEAKRSGILVWLNKTRPFFSRSIREQLCRSLLINKSGCLNDGFELPTFLKRNHSLAWLSLNFNDGTKRPSNCERRELKLMNATQGGVIPTRMLFWRKFALNESSPPPKRLNSVVGVTMCYKCFLAATCQINALVLAADFWSNVTRILLVEDYRRNPSHIESRCEAWGIKFAVTREMTPCSPQLPCAKSRLMH